VHLLDSQPYDFHQVDMIISLLTRAYRKAVEFGANIPASYEAMKDMINLGSEAGVINACLYSFVNLTRLGLSVDQATKVVMRIPQEEGSASGYPMPLFNDAVKSMLPAKVEPELVVEAFEYLGGERPWFNMGDYQAFRAAMTFGCPIKGLTPNEMLRFFVTRARNGGKEIPLLEEVIGDLNQRPDVELIIDKERYFTEVQGELEHFAQPYRNKRSLVQGARDLEELAVAKSYLWEEVGEGMWVFDPANEIWYSLGGQLELPGMGAILSGTADWVRHNFIPYDISALSDTPFLFHVHPEALDSFIAPPRDSMTYPAFRDDITRFLTATPSRADYGAVAELLKQSQGEVSTRSFIVHALGVTEFTYPNDIAQLEDMKEKSRDIRDQAMLCFDMDDYVLRNGFSSDRLDLVQRLMHDLDERLPDEFNVILHPSETDC